VKHFNQARKYGSRIVAAGAAVALPVLVNATPAGPYDGITDAVDFAAVATAVGAIGALIAVALVARKGVRMVLSMIGR
jgi:hypothetical protein